MEQQHSSTSKVTVEYHDPHDVYKLLAPGLIPRLPLYNLHWQSHSGPLRSIGTLHVDLVRAGEGGASAAAAPSTATASPALRRSDSTTRDDGFQTQTVGGRPASLETVESSSQPPGSIAGGQRRHQIPGLRRTPYLKVLLVRCDDNDSYKSSVRSEVREWIKMHVPQQSGSSKKSSNSNQERHDAFEWLIVHVVIPNTVAATQPRSAGAKSEGVGLDSSKSSSRWRTGSTPLLDKFRSDFNGSGKSAVDHVAQIRIGINDVPYDLLPRVVPAVPTGYSETEQDAENAWNELITKFRHLILSSFDRRVGQYEEDIKEKDSQRTLPGWNFCTFFILKEGLARGFENVGLVEDALVGYDELSVGLDLVVQEQAETGSPERHGGVLLTFTEELKRNTEQILAGVQGGGNDEEAVDLQQSSRDADVDKFDEIPVSATKKAYRDMILANNVSVFDFRCYIFSRQIGLLLRLANAQSTREELLAKLREQQESVLHGVAPQAPAPQQKTEEAENLSRLAEICRRTLEFIPAVSHIMRRDIVAALEAEAKDGRAGGMMSPTEAETIDNLVASFAFSVAQQILAQTSTKALPIPPSTLPPSGADEQKSSIPEPKTMMHPARSSSLHVQPVQAPLPSPGVFPGPGSRASASAVESRDAMFVQAGLEELAARRADLYLLSRSILSGLGKKRGWSDGWEEAPLIGEADEGEMEDVSLDDDDEDDDNPEKEEASPPTSSPLSAGINSNLLRTATDNSDDFYRLYEIFTDKALRHFTVAGQDYSAHASMSDLAVLKYHLKEYRAATSFFCLTTPFFGDGGWSWLELSMLVMYSESLREMKSKEYVRVALKLLTKACVAEKEWLDKKATSVSRGLRAEQGSPDMSPITRVVGSATELAASMTAEAKVLLDNFVTDIEIAGAPRYREGRDSCEVSIQLRSLLPGDLDVQSAAMRVSSVDKGPCQEIWFTKEGDQVLSRGTNTIALECKSLVPGKYRVDNLTMRSGKLVLHFDRDPEQGPQTASGIFRRPDIELYQPAGALNVDLSATRHTALDRNNCLDLTLTTGWNSLSRCEIRVKPGTGGLRLLAPEATLVSPDVEFARPPEAGVFHFGEVDAGKSVTVRFPFSVEQEMAVVSAKIEVTYTTVDGDTFYSAKASSVPIALALNVNVQDVFKHKALFSRFSVSTASRSPLRLFETELLESPLFESSSGHAPASTVTVFPKQPATLLYKVRRKAGVKTGSGAAVGAKMYLKLHYSQLDSEIAELVRATVGESLGKTELAPYKRVIERTVVTAATDGLDGDALARASLLGHVSTGFLAGIAWEDRLRGLGDVGGTKQGVGAGTSAFFAEWLRAHPRLAIPPISVTDRASILIPVDIPSVSVVHTADIRVQRPASSRSIYGDRPGGTPTVTVGQVLTATLHLRWTRTWDTGKGRREDKEFSYELTAQADSWLLGGRRKGHFVIAGDGPASSTPETEAEIPLTLIPQREGWLPYPAVEIREIGADGEAVPSQGQTFEVDFRNLGETVRVVGGRSSVTASLYTSGPGGGPLVLEGERVAVEGQRVVAS